MSFQVSVRFAPGTAAEEAQTAEGAYQATTAGGVSRVGAAKRKEDEHELGSGGTS